MLILLKLDSTKAVQLFACIRISIRIQIDRSNKAYLCKRCAKRLSERRKDMEEANSEQRQRMRGRRTITGFRATNFELERSIAQEANSLIALELL